MKEIIDNTELEKAIRRAKRREKFEEFKTKAKPVIDWTMAHKTEVGAIATSLLIGGKRFLKSRARSNALKEQKYLKERFVYDNRLGHYCELKRNLKPSEWDLIAKRREAGETMTSILSDMNVLK